MFNFISKKPIENSIKIKNTFSEYLYESENLLIQYNQIIRAAKFKIPGKYGKSLLAISSSIAIPNKNVCIVKY